MRRLIVVLVVGAAAAWAAVALATPGQGQSSRFLSVGALNEVLAFNTDLTSNAEAVRGSTKYSAQTSCRSS